MGMVIRLNQLSSRQRLHFSSVMWKAMERKWSSREFESLIDRYRDEQCLWIVMSPQYVEADVQQATLQCISVALDGIPTDMVS